MEAPTVIKLASDPQQDAVYRAHSIADAFDLNGREFTSVSAAKDYVMSFISSTWFVKRFGNLRLSVTLDHGSENISTCRSTWRPGDGDLTHELDMSPNHLSEALILHELAHAIASSRVSMQEGHGPVWAGIFLFLVGTKLGPQTRDAFRIIFDECQVQYVPVSFNGTKMYYGSP